MRVSSCLRFVARLCTTKVLLSVTGLSSSEISSIRRYLDKILLIGGLKGLWVMMKAMICFFLAFAFCGCNRSSRRINLALSTALLISLTGYPLRAKSVIKVCEAFSNRLSVLQNRVYRRAWLYGKLCFWCLG